jgi:hypothetical protein
MSKMGGGGAKGGARTFDLVDGEFISNEIDHGPAVKHLIEGKQQGPSLIGRREVVVLNVSRMVTASQNGSGKWLVCGDFMRNHVVSIAFHFLSTYIS